MGKLNNKQFEFMKAFGDLINYAYSLGYTLSPGCMKPVIEQGHKLGSYHYKGLAVDLNLFKDNKWLKDTEDHWELGEYWERIGGTWGGRWDDGNHYSWGE